jgi:hypothetical protein
VTPEVEAEAERRGEQEKEIIQRILDGKDKLAAGEVLGERPLEENPDGDVLDDGAVPEEHVEAEGRRLTPRAKSTEVGIRGLHLPFVQKAGKPAADGVLKRPRVITERRRKPMILCSKGLNGSASPEMLAQAILLNYIPARSSEELLCG